ncbi:hypothetical protein [Flavobacterium sp. HJSW_4]|uniref:hypothetical protein n=1 Tax=Flavobacterium sp. HJSW_4 TaxID=3344660 RepID=UPI0035F22171
MKKIILIFLLLFGFQGFCQIGTNSIEDEIYIKYFGKCFSEVKPLPEVKNRAKLNKIPFCSLYQCVRYIQYVEYEKKIQDAILKRAVEIATLLYKNNSPIYLISGMSSGDHALRKNINLNDDNKLIYVSIAECVTTTTLEKIQEAVNNETTKLINSKK